MTGGARRLEDAEAEAAERAAPFAVGDVVFWLGNDDDVPDGTAGTVSTVHADGDVEVKFKRPRTSPVTFTFKPERLEKNAARTARLAAASRAPGGSGASEVREGAGEGDGQGASEAGKGGEIELKAVFAPNVEPPATSEESGFVSTVLVLINMLTAEALSSDEEHALVLADVKEECVAFGEVSEVFIPRPSEGDIHGIGKVFVEFTTETSAAAAAAAMSGREFDGRPIMVAFLDEAKWDDQLLDDHSPPV